MIPSMLIKEPGEVKDNRETWKSAEKCMCTILYGNTKEKQIDTHSKMEWQMYFSENLPGVNLVVMNYKIRRNKNWPATRPARYSLVWSDHSFHYYLWWQKNGKTWSGRARLCARVAMEEGLLSAWVTQNIGQSQLINEYCYLLNSEFLRTQS